MGFGGGGSGSFVLPNHDHTNILADGSALDEAVSLINDGAADVTFNTWCNALIATGLLANKLELLDDSGDLASAATYTYTPGTALTSTKYSKIFTVYDFQMTAILALQCKVNGLATATYGNIIDGHYGTVYGSTEYNAQAQWAITNIDAQFAYVNTDVIGQVDFLFNKSSGQMGMMAESCTLKNNGKYQVSCGRHGNAISSISSLEFKTSVSTWKTNARFITFGVLR